MSGTKTYKLTFEFDDLKTRQGFITWFLDCGGDQDYWNCLELQNDPERAKILKEKYDMDVIHPVAYFRDWPPGCPQELENIVIDAPTLQEGEE